MTYADDAALLAECVVDTYRGSGPGGQKRNKTDSAVRLRHRPSGIMVTAVESRSQAENRARALQRLRRALALRLRHAVDDASLEALRAGIGKDGRLRLGRRDGRFLPAASAALDLMVESRGSVADAAQRIGLTTAQLSRFLTSDEDVLVEANRLRASLGLRPLRDD